MPPPRRLGEASTPSGDQHWDPRPVKPHPPAPPDLLTPLQAARRADLTTISIAPWPADYDDDHRKCHIGKLRSHYGDQHHPLCDKVLVKFSKTLSTILRHDTISFKDVWSRDVDKSKWPSGIIWPIDDFCHYMGRLLHFTRHYDSSEFRDVVIACMPDCPIHPTVTWPAAYHRILLSNC